MTEECDMFTPCPACNKIGYSLAKFEQIESEEIQLMGCATDECRVSEYYPEKFE